MLYSYNWIKEYVDALPEPERLSELLTMSGTEVDSVRDLSEGISGVVTAEVQEIQKHPNADRLKLCQVRTAEEVYSIVCGAGNMKEGDRVALALSGAKLPGGVKIKKSRIRGVDSSGMMCSEVELGLADTSEGIMILPADTPLGMDATEALGLKDLILDVSVTPNRADVLSIRGMAREIAALTKAAFTDVSTTVEETGPPIEGLVDCSIEPGSTCRRYAARVVEGVKIGPSPDFLRRRLEALGIRPINNVVDVTNYVLLALGQPMHAFDLDKIAGKKIVVRSARSGETIETLDNKERKLKPGMAVICDGAGPVALGGVMGGRVTEVGEDTRNILLESAWFEPVSIRRTSRAMGLTTDSSYRFERGVDIEGAVTALDMAAALIASVGGGVTAKGVIDVYPERFKSTPVTLRAGRASEVLGMAIDADTVKDILGRLGVAAEGDGPEFTCFPPSFRMDLKEEVDLIEEVARVSGYEKIPTVMPVAELTGGGLPGLFTLKKSIRDTLLSDGFIEVINYNFVSEEIFSLPGEVRVAGVRILNPLSTDQSVMRRSLMPALLTNLRDNLDMKNEEVRVFETAPVFTAGEGLPVENWKTAGLIYGHRWPEGWSFPVEPLDFYDIKGVVEKLLEGTGAASVFEVRELEARYQGFFHPGKSASITLDGASAGVLGELHPDGITRFGLRGPAYLFELDLSTLGEKASGVKRFKPLPKYPASERDIAFIVDAALTYDEIIRAVNAIDTKLIEKVNLFDVYYGRGVPEGKKSLALKIRYRNAERTLVQEEVERIHEEVAAELTSRFGAEIRGEG